LAHAERSKAFEGTRFPGDFGAKKTFIKYYYEGAQFRNEQGVQQSKVIFELRGCREWTKTALGKLFLFERLIES
jgi:hypothetical protein